MLSVGVTIRNTSHIRILTNYYNNTRRILRHGMFLQHLTDNCDSFRQGG